MPAAVQHTFYVENAIRKVATKMKPFMVAIATEYANTVKIGMRNSPATGRIYRRGGRTHQASAPGEAPAPDTGNLMRSVKWNVHQEGFNWLADVGSNLPYALFLEYGAVKVTRSSKSGKPTISWRLAPRPIWQPSMLVMRRRIPALMQQYRIGVV